MPNSSDVEVSKRRRNYKIMSKEEAENGKKSSWLELEITGIVSNVSPELFNLKHLTSLFLNGNNISHLPSDIARLELLQVLDVSYNTLTYLPHEIGSLIRLKELHVANNLLHSLPFELGNLFQLQVLNIDGNPLPNDIVNLYFEQGVHSLLHYLIDNLPAQPIDQPFRGWIPLNAPSRRGIPFTLMCYNILCDKYCTRQQYGYASSWVLNWQYRSAGIMKEILDRNADIICLQEVESCQYKSYFEPKLLAEGYCGVFSPKSRARTMLEAERKHVDGCAIFFKKFKFTLVKEHLVEFSQLALTKGDRSETMLNRVMPRDNIGLVAVLRVNHPDYIDRFNQFLMIANVHIHWDPEFSDVKLIQTIMFMDELHNLSKEYNRELPLVICGDLNSLPSSGVIEFLQNGSVSIEHDDFRDLRYDSSLLRSLTTNSDSEVLSHCFALKNSMEQLPLSFTNCTFDFKGVIDYIFYSQQHFVPLGGLSGVDFDWIDSYNVIGCPNIAVYSDHFSLMVELELKFPRRSNDFYRR